MDHALMLIVAILLALVIPLWAWHLKRSREIAEKWAIEKGYTITKIDRRYLRAGPFFWRRGRGHEVFFVVVRDAQGMQRAGYIRTGGWFLGQLSEQVTVDWAEGAGGA